MTKRNREFVTNATYGCYAREGYNRCACGNDKLQMCCHTYKDGSRGYTLYCWDCGRMLDVDGTEEQLRKAWNDYNAGTVKLEYKLIKVPETVTIYAKPEDDIDTLLKEALFKKVVMDRVPTHSAQEDDV